MSEIITPAMVEQKVDGWVNFQEADDHEVDLPFAEPEQSGSGGVFSPQASISPASFVIDAARDFRDALKPAEPLSEEEDALPPPAVLGDLLEKTRIRLGQNDMLFEGSARGKFADNEANLVDGDDLDIPPFMRKKKK